MIFMTNVLETKQILTELKAMRKDIDFIKVRIEDIFLTSEEEGYLDEAEKEHQKGKSISLKDFDKQMRN